MNPGLLVDCGCTCTVYGDGSGVEMHYCPMHRAAPDLLAACEALVATYERHNCPPDAYLARDLPAIRAAIAKARKEA